MQQRSKQCQKRYVIGCYSRKGMGEQHPVFAVHAPTHTTSNVGKRYVGRIPCWKYPIIRMLHQSWVEILYCNDIRPKVTLLNILLSDWWRWISPMTELPWQCLWGVRVFFCRRWNIWSAIFQVSLDVHLLHGMQGKTDFHVCKEATLLHVQ